MYKVANTQKLAGMGKTTRKSNGSVLSIFLMFHLFKTGLQPSYFSVFETQVTLNRRLPTWGLSSGTPLG